MAGNRQRLRKAVDQLLCKLRGIIDRAQARRENHEFIARQTRDRVRLAHHQFQTLRRRLQNQIADLVTIVIVDLLEAIKVEEQHAEQPAAALLRQRSEEHTSELQSLMRNSYAVFCWKKKKK